MGRRLTISEQFALAPATRELHEAAERYAAAHMKHEQLSRLYGAARRAASPYGAPLDLDWQHLALLLSRRNTQQRSLSTARHEWAREYSFVRGVTKRWAERRCMHEMSEVLTAWRDANREPMDVTTEALRKAWRGYTEAATQEEWAAAAADPHRTGHVQALTELESARAKVSAAAAWLKAVGKHWEDNYVLWHDVTLRWAQHQRRRELRKVAEAASFSEGGTVFAVQMEP